MESFLAALVARRFYLEGRSKMQIAEELGVSRFKVARILDQARSEGIVRIEVAEPPDVDLDLSAEVTRRLGLRQVVVVRTAADDQGALYRQLGRACAVLLAERLSDDDVLGVSWGRTLHAMTDVMPKLPRATVVQIVGSVPSADLDVNSLELVRRFGASTAGEVHALHVPMVLDSPEVAASLRATEYVARTLAAFDDLTCAVVGIGAWRAGESSLRSALPAGLVRALDDAGVVADVCSTLLDGDGHVVGAETVPPRCIAISTDQLRSVPDVIAVAGGAAKVDAIAAVARAGLVHRLVTDVAAARGLLEE